MSVEPLSLALLALLLGAIALDLLIGDPRWLPHPVVAMGRLIEVLERRWNHGSPRARRCKGFLLTGCVVVELAERQITLTPVLLLRNNRSERRSPL